ncbi:MBL fold metallo-hydrolase [Chitinophaga sp. S165]|uniref:MBL fold metallo-hydrolase n=1 Tax=Chitinophaga sp. S165 TaxID=2135462 RepID=UPI000D71ADB9|nr:MBL fold metallo-hydrolase [Chitinophaga sp. S165]PWV48953.1 L-ascorbate metabolism protein UlaG (beta-lactamase superfamily) [Chitinophaga sp. S165]
MAEKTSIQLIRNATVVFNYAGKRFLIDPMLAEKEAYSSFPGTPNSHLRNPLTDLPVKAESLANADAIIVTHLHADHWDKIAKEVLPKDTPLFSQNEDDANVIREAGFTDVRVFGESATFDNVRFQKTECQHGPDALYAIPEMAARMGKVSGLYFNEPGEPSVYFAADTIWIPAVESTLKNFQPGIVVLNAGAATLDGFGAIIMGKEDILKVHEIVPNATIIAIHMEALNHCVLSRRELRDYVNEKGIAGKVLIPEDGEVIVF